MQSYPNPYGSQPPQKNNTLLISLISVLCVLVVALIITFILFAAGIISFPSGTNTESEPISVADSDTAAVSENAEVVQTTMYVANVQNSIYFRSAPAEDSGNIICEIPRSTPVGFIENTDAVFAKINYNGQTGWVKREYLSSTQPPAQAPVSQDTSVKSTMYVANVKHSIYLRSTPQEVSGNIICEIPLGTPVGFIENTSSIFAKINYNGRIGYSKREYLSYSAPHRSSGGSTMYVTNVKHSIYLRSTPQEVSGNIICEIPVGNAVTFLENANGTFYKISWNGKVGYSKSEYLSW